MSDLSEGARADVRGWASVGRMPLIFTCAIGLSAFLLFAIQPMFARMVLPQLGGSPAVWSVAMVFFQAVLLAGYAWAHALTHWLPARTGALLHVALLLVVMVLALPIGLSQALGQPPAEGVAMWTLGLFALSVGLPFFAVSAHGPLLQAWFARAGGAGANPYPLYAASNAGSLAALLAYPFLIEPFFSVSQQTLGWTFGFGFLIAGVSLAAACLPRATTALTARRTAEAPPAPPWRMRLAWCWLAAIPSGLLVATTAHISTDVAAAPLLWVVPLALFLLTFIIVFGDTPALSHRGQLRLQPALALMALVAGPVLGQHSALVALLLALAALFATAMVFHGELARLKPAPEHLTGFYMWMSLGGVVGGLFAGLIAPNLFSTVLEYPLLLALAVLLRGPGAERPAWRDVARLSFICAAALMTALLARQALAGLSIWKPMADVGLPLIGAGVMLTLVTYFNRPWISLAAIGTPLLALALAAQFKPGQTNIRSFFGVSKIVTSQDGQVRYLAHGTTYHGAQRVDQIRPGVMPDPLTYYWRGGPFDQAIEAARAAKGGRLARVAVIGLGAGSQACLSKPGESWRFYEIDPEVARIAKDPSLFTFMSACAPDAPVILGDARLKLKDSLPAGYDLIIVDAFSSDSIPLHLLTREAFALYREKLTPGGAIALHLSNRNLTLAPFVAATAAADGLRTWYRPGGGIDAAAAAAGKAPAQIALVSENPAHGEALEAARGWREITVRHAGQIRPWTDDYANILAAAWMRLRGGADAL